MRLIVLICIVSLATDFLFFFFFYKSSILLIMLTACQHVNLYLCRAQSGSLPVALVQTYQTRTASVHCNNIRRFYGKIPGMFLQAPVNSIFRNQAQYDSKGHVLFLVIWPFKPTELFSSSVG